MTGVRYIILSATEHDAGLYFCTATNKFGSDTKQLTLNVQISGGSGSGNRSSDKRSRHKELQNFDVIIIIVLTIITIIIIIIIIIVIVNLFSCLVFSLFD